MSDSSAGQDNPQLAVGPVLAGAPLERARMAAVLVHGRDQDEQLMLDVVRRLSLPDVAYVLPVAAGREWYSGRYFDPVVENEPQVSWALEALVAAIAVANQAGVPDGRVVVAGFSQGACLIAELVARWPRIWAGAAVLTGSLLGPQRDQVTPAPVAGLPMFFGFSRYDEWIAPERAHGTARAFAAAGARVTVETYQDREHHINDAAVRGLRRLLTPDARK